MSQIRFACPACNAAFTVPAAKAGHKATCPRCRQRILIPAPWRNVTALGTLLPPDAPQGAQVDGPFPPRCTPEATATSGSLPGDFSKMPANRTKLLGLVAFGIVGVAILVIAGTVAVIRKDSGSVREKEADVVLKDWWHPSVTSAKLERMIEKLQYAPPGYVWFNHKAEISFLGAAQEGDWRGHRCFEIPYEGPHSRAKVLYWLVNSFVPEDLGL